MAWASLLVVFVVSLLAWMKVHRDQNKINQNIIDQSDPGPILDAAQKLADMMEQQLAFKTNEIQRLEHKVNDLYQANQDLRFDLDKALQRIAALEGR